MNEKVQQTYEIFMDLADVLKKYKHPGYDPLCIALALSLLTGSAIAQSLYNTIKECRDSLEEMGEFIDEINNVIDRHLEKLKMEQILVAIMALVNGTLMDATGVEEEELRDFTIIQIFEAKNKGVN